MDTGFSTPKTGWAVVYVTHPCFGAENIHILRKDYPMDDKIKRTKKPKRTRDIRFDLHISQEEYDLIQERMTEAGTANMSAFIRKMALNGYVLHVDLSPVKDLVSLQCPCSNNLNQVAVNVNTYGGVYPQELTALQKDYAELWKPLSELIKWLAEIVKL